MGNLNDRKRKLIIGVFLIPLMVSISCNLPVRDNVLTVTELPDAVYTEAAKTVDAQIQPTMNPTGTNVATNTPVVSVPTPTEEVDLTPTPTETVIPTEIPEVIFFDDFSDTSGWYTNENDRYGFRYSPDGYHIYNRINMGLIWSIREQEYSGVALEVDGTRLEGPSESYFGVICKCSDNGNNYYALVISDSGFYGFGLMENGEYEFVDSGIADPGIINGEQGATNRIRGVCNENHFLIYANNQLVLDIWDDTLDDGIIGLVVGNQGTDIGSEFRFNDFAITWP